MSHNVGAFWGGISVFCMSAGYEFGRQGKNAIYCLCTLKIHVEILTPNLIVRRWDLWRVTKS